MDQSFLSHTYQFRVDALNSTSRAEQIKNILRTSLERAPGGQRVETDSERRTLTISSSEPLDVTPLKQDLQPYGYHLREYTAEEVGAECACDVRIDGMTCHSCEIIVERAWKKMDGITSVDVHAGSGKAKIGYVGAPPTIAQLQAALGNEKYRVRENGAASAVTGSKPTLLQLVGLFALVLVLGKILSVFGLFSTSFAVGKGMSLGAIFVVGLVAASSSCIAVSGGLLLSTAARFNQRYGASSPMRRMRPVVLFVLGRIAGYGLLGGLLGVIGKALAPSPVVTALIAILAAIYMIVMGLDMLQIAPAWLKRLMPSMPKFVSHRVMDAETKEHPLMPFGLGALTFFLPCGFTQALQLYALTTGSFATGALSLAAFALGTAPALLALGWASSSLKGKAGKFFFTFSGVLVIVLGFWNIQNSLAIAGYPVSFPKFAVTSNAATSPSNVTGLAPIEDGKQIVRMKVNAGYAPNHFTIRAGTPVRWEIDATNGGGCASVLVSRQLGIQKLLALDATNVIEFTPTQTGEVPFSCSMGMYRGSFTVLPAA